MTPTLTNVFRIENELGLGPYVESNWEKRGLYAPDWVRSMQMKHNDQDHPAPWEDGLDLSWNEFCGLISESAVYEWFDGWLETLAENGFWLSRYAVPSTAVRVGTSGKQVLFMREEGQKPKEIIPIWM